MDNLVSIIVSKFFRWFQFSNKSQEHWAIDVSVQFVVTVPNTHKQLHYLFLNRIILIWLANCRSSIYFRFIIFIEIKADFDNVGAGLSLLLLGLLLVFFVLHSKQLLLYGIFLLIWRLYSGTWSNSRQQTLLLILPMLLAILINFRDFWVLVYDVLANVLFYSFGFILLFH